MCVVTVLGVTHNAEQEEIQSLPSVVGQSQVLGEHTDPADKCCAGEALRALTRRRWGKPPQRSENWSRDVNKGNIVTAREGLGSAGQTAYAKALTSWPHKQAQGR